jgi:hypothetical protein
MNSYVVVTVVAVLDLVVAFFASMVGYTVNGSVTAGSATWSWTDMVGFLWDMISFNIDGMPFLISAAFIVMNLLSLFVLVKLIRGTD